MIRMKRFRGRPGFTLVELLVVVAIMAVIATVGFLGLANYRSGKNLDFTINEIIAALRATQERAVTQENGKAWGIHFINSTSGVQNYAVFSGAVFAPAGIEQTYGLRRGIRFTDPSPSSTKDVFFQAISGKPLTYFSVTLKGDTTQTKNIIVATSGVILVQ